MAQDSQAYVERYLEETIAIARQLDRTEMVRAASLLRELRQAGGRLFILGVGGSAANASHAANDFRKIAGIESYAPTDNVAELTAWANDVGWHAIFVEWLKTSRVGARDALLVLSVGGGSATVSRNLVLAMEHAKAAGARLVSIVSRDGGRARELSDACILVPVVAQERITPHAEGWQGVVWHCLVNAIL
ncbi:MAG: SIS domain-containing protein [Planctomycetes bacterium]|nr:SIS domain-containing protein [Planctomycetota bacterium]